MKETKKQLQIPKQLVVLHIVTGLGRGGAENMLFRLLMEPKYDWQKHFVVSLLPFDREGLFKSFENQRIPCFSLHITGMISALFGCFHLVCLFFKIRPNVIQTWLYHADLLGMILGFITRRPVLWNIRCSSVDIMLKSPRKAFLLKLLAFLSTRTTLVIANSRAGIDFHKNVMGYRCHWVLIPNGFDLDSLRRQPDAGAQWRESLGIQPDTFVIGYVGRFDPFKDVETLASAAKILLTQADFKFKFILVGPGMIDQNQHLVKILQLNKVDRSFVMVGPQTEMSKIYSMFDILTLSSQSEGFPNVVAEAMACEVPVVATNVGDVREIVNGHGWIAPPKDPGKLAELWITAQKSNLKEVGSNCRKHIQLHYDLAMTRRRYFDLYAAVHKKTLSAK